MNVSTSARLVQQEQLRLQKENDFLSTEKEKLYRYFKMIEELYWVNQTITTAENPLDIANHLLYKVMTTIGTMDGSLSCLDMESNELIFLVVHGELKRSLQLYRIPTDVGIAGWVVNNQQPLIINTPRQDWRFSQQVDQKFEFSTESIMTVPVMHLGELIGVSQLVNKMGNYFDDADQALALAWSDTAVKVFIEIQRRIDADQATVEDFVNNLTDPTPPSKKKPETSLDDVSSFEDPTFEETFLQ